MATSLTNKSRRMPSTRNPSITRVFLVGLIAASLTLTVHTASLAADHQWQSGVWRDSGDARTYVIVRGTVRFHLEDVPPTDKRALDAPAGTAVKFAVEGSRAFVLDRRNVEHELRVLRTVDLNYTATGAGH